MIHVMMVMVFAFLTQLARNIIAQLVADIAKASKLILRQTRGQLAVQGLAFLSNAVKVLARFIRGVNMHDSRVLLTSPALKISFRLQPV